MKDLLEQEIDARSQGVLRCYQQAERAGRAGDLEGFAAWRSEARQHALAMARLIELRTPERVKCLENERGLV